MFLLPVWLHTVLGLSASTNSLVVRQACVRNLIIHKVFGQIFFSDCVSVCNNDLLFVNRVEEVFSWLVEVVEDSADLWDEGRLVWSVRYVLEGSERIRQHHSPRVQKDSPHRTVDDTRTKITARFEIQKDDIQAVLPISKVSKHLDLLFIQSLYLRKQTDIPRICTCVFRIY